MKKGNGSWPVAPHGILALAVVCILIMVVAHSLGFRAMATAGAGVSA